MKRLCCLSIAFILGARAFHTAAEPPTPPPSTYAPADELVKLAGDYVKQLRDELKDESAFETAQPKVKKEANTLACFALVLGLHDTDNPLKKSAPALLAASGKLAKAADFAAAQSALAEVESALDGQTSAGPELKWTKIASLGQLMKQVTFINARLKRGAKPSPRFEAQAADNARYATTLAVIAQCVMADTHEVKNPDDVGRWFEYCAAMRDASAQSAAALRARDAATAQTSLQKLEQSCNTCHKTFRVEHAE